MVIYKPQTVSAHVKQTLIRDRRKISDALSAHLQEVVLHEAWTILAWVTRRLHSSGLQDHRLTITLTGMLWAENERRSN